MACKWLKGLCWLLHGMKAILQWLSPFFNRALTLKNSTNPKWEGLGIVNTRWSWVDSCNESRTSQNVSFFRATCHFTEWMDRFLIMKPANLACRVLLGSKRDALHWDSIHMPYLRYPVSISSFIQFITVTMRRLIGASGDHLRARPVLGLHAVSPWSFDKECQASPCHIPTRPCRLCRFHSWIMNHDLPICIGNWHNPWRNPPCRHSKWLKWKVLTGHVTGIHQADCPWTT